MEQQGESDPAGAVSGGDGRGDSWARLLALIAPHYSKAGKGRQPIGLERMLRIYFLQQWFTLSDPQAEDAIYDSESMRRFAGVELGDDASSPVDRARLSGMPIGAVLPVRGKARRDPVVQPVASK